MFPEAKVMYALTATHGDAIPCPATPAPQVVHASDGAVDGDALDQSMHLMGATMTYPRNSEIFGENEPADYLYKVVNGGVRTYKILIDGRRQIGGFYLP